ncbi:SGNH/GDSL hydrolase family protein [Chryseobacterium sp. MP_3.2]|uniref:SGNH/GDSL hydrolase family protein n=1 Tax=Chryseobacterium sp. MP_3.2 TaxID=3071712 RepID=UPI002E0721B2|nr:lysophospholipase L1-like esterase [Chryseobacterium sp. MP_3.2]
MKSSYTLHLLKSLPLLPIIYFQGKKIKKEVQFLPEAKNTEGVINVDGEKSLKILFLGESSFAGVGSEFHKDAFAGHFSAEISKLINSTIHWKVYAKVGATVEELQRKIIPTIKETHCDLLVIGIGANDTFKFAHPKKWRKNIQLLIDALRGKFPETPLLFAQLPTIEVLPAFTKEMKFVLGNHKNLLAAHLNEQVLQNKKVYFPMEKINIVEWLGKLKEGETVAQFFSDGIHPSEFCYELWAKDCVAYLKDSKIKLT